MKGRAMRLTGHWVIWELHQKVLVDSDTEFGSIVYKDCPDAKERRALEAMAVAAKVFMVWLFGLQLGYNTYDDGNAIMKSW